MRRAGRALAAVAVVVGLGAGLTAAVPALPAVERGPAPTLAGVTAAVGPHAVTATAVRRADVTGFGGGMLFAPADTAGGPYGVVTVAPGFRESAATLAWLGPRVASRGFVVLLIDTLDPDEFPTARAAELLAAIDWVVADSPVRDRADPARAAVLGHSMGGGAALEAALARPGLRAAIPMAPWDPAADFAGVRVPTLVLAAADDTIAPPVEHAERFYASLTAPARAYALLPGRDHNFSNAPDDVTAGLVLSWLGRFLDGDTRYTRLLCRGTLSAAVTSQQDTCPAP